MREWFKFEMKADPAVAEIHITDYIGDWIDQQISELYGVSLGVTAKAFIEELAALPEAVKTIRVFVNSPGGDVFGAVNIANALRDQRVVKGRKVETIVEGLAASAASLVVMAGQPARISDNGLLMIHDAWTVAIGNADDMRKAGETLDKVRDASIIPTYQWHSKLDAKDIAKLMAAVTWMDADEAIENGFADEKMVGLKAAASIDPRAMAKLKVPEKFKEQVAAMVLPVEDRAPVAAPTPPPEPPVPAVDAAEVVRICGEAGLDLVFAQALIGESLQASALEGRVTAEKTARDAAKVREDDIRALCAMTKQDDLATGYVSGAMTVAAVKDHLAKITAKLDKVEIDAHLQPDHGTNRKPVIDVQAVYAKRNRLALTQGKE